MSLSALNLLWVEYILSGPDIAEEHDKKCAETGTSLAAASFPRTPVGKPHFPGGNSQSSL